MRPKLLLADDSVTIQRVIELTFADEDVQVLTAGDGEQAIHRVEADRPDIVLADIGMPKRSGYEVAAFIKGHAELSHIPVLLLTGAFEPVDEERAQAVGCDGVVVKPFEPQNVIARVRELLQGGGGRSTSRAVADVPRPVERLASHRVLELPPRYDTPPPRAMDPAVGNAAPAPVGNARAAGDSALDDYFDRLDAAFANIVTQGAEQPPRRPEPPVHEPQVMPRPSGPVAENELDWFDSPAQGTARLPSLAPRALPEPQRPMQAELNAGASESPAPSANADLPATFASPPSTIHWPVPGVIEGFTGGIRHPEPPPPEPPDQSPTIAPEPGGPVPPAPVPPVAAPSPAPAITPRVVPPSQAQDAPVLPAPVQASSPTLADAFSALLAVEEGESGAAPVRLMSVPMPPQVTDELIDTITRRVVERLAPDAVRDVVAQVVSEVAERLVRDEISRLRNR